MGSPWLADARVRLVERGKPCRVPQELGQHTHGGGTSSTLGPVFQASHRQCRPPCLMAGARTATVVSVEVLVEEHQFAEIGILGVELAAPVDGPVSLGVGQKGG